MFSAASIRSHVVWVTKKNFSKLTSRRFVHASSAVGGDAHDQSRLLSTQTNPEQQEIVLKSPFGPVQVPHICVQDFVFQDVQRYTKHPALTCGASGRSYDFGTTFELTTRFAKALIAKCGVQPGDTVALLLPNIPEYVIAIHGSLMAGCIVTFVNPLYTPDEIRRQFENAGTKVIVTIPLLIDAAKIVAPLLPGYKATICVGGKDQPQHNIISAENLLMTGDYDVDLPKGRPDSVAILPYSSGTTGLPKGVQLTHRNLVANQVQGLHENIVSHKKTSDTHQDTVLTVLPFFHIFGFNGIMNLSLYHGIHLVTLPKFTPEDYIKCLMEYKPELLFVVPSLLLFLATHPAVTKDHLKSVQTIISGAAPATPSLLDKFRQKIDHDVDIRQGYGMTETSPATIMVPARSPASKLGSTGQLYPGTEAKVIDPETGITCGPHKCGELLVRGPQVMPGYWNNEKATQETIDSEGWLHTGDVVYYDDDQYFYIIDRTKELIKVKGNQVSPTELEALLLEHPGIADAAVVGIPDELAGEVPRAFVVLRPGFNPPISERDVISHVHPRVVHYKRLAGGVRIIEAIPRNPAGKIMRKELKVLGAEFC